MSWVLLGVALLFSAPLFSEAPIRVGMSAAFSGASGQLGEEYFQGADLYFQKANYYNGISGRQIEVLRLDDAYDPVRTVQNTVQLIETEKVDFLFGYVGTPTLTRILPLLKRYQNENIAMYFPFTGAEPQRRLPYSPFVFNLRASYLQEVGGLVDQFVALGRKRIGVVYQSDSYGRNGWGGVRSALARHGIKIASEATYHRGASVSDSFLAQARLIEDAGVDAVVIVASYQASAAFIRDFRDLGNEAPVANISFVGSESLLTTLADLEASSGRVYTRNLIQSQVVPYLHSDYSAVREYRELMAKTYPDVAPSYVSLEGFLAAKLMVRLMKQVPAPFSADRIPQYARLMKNYNLGIGTPVRFDRSNQGLDRVYFMSAVDGAFLPIKDWSLWQL